MKALAGQILFFVILTTCLEFFSCESEGEDLSQDASQEQNGNNLNGKPGITNSDSFEESKILSSRQPRHRHHFHNSYYVNHSGTRFFLWMCLHPNIRCGQKEYGFDKKTCRKRFSSRRCKVDSDRCRNVACHNGGRCTNRGDVMDGFRCRCRNGFTGKFCQTKINKCATLPCMNGGICAAHHDTYTCKCSPDFEGHNCQNQKNSDWPFAWRQTQKGSQTNRPSKCIGIKCKNGGTCEDLVNDFLCRCHQEFTGKYCETELFCCQNGDKCFDLDYRCDDYLDCDDGSDEDPRYCQVGRVSHVTPTTRINQPIRRHAPSSKTSVP